MHSTLRPTLSKLAPALAAALLISACAKPVTQTPGVSSQEVAAEAKAHEDAVKASQAAGNGGRGSLDRTQSIAVLSDVAKRVLPSATDYCKQFTGAPDCGFAVALDKDDAPLNAYADGKQVVISPAMIAFTKTNDELAVVVSHELAHNILTHPQRATQNAMIGGLGGTLVDMAAQYYGINAGVSAAQLGQQMAVARYSQDFERDADYLGVYILSAAGYDVNTAPAFWQRMSIAGPDGIYRASSHPTNPERAVMLRKAIEEIQAKKAAGQPLTPNLRPSK
jgi:predicted Zn-dependent protease